MTIIIYKYAYCIEYFLVSKMYSIAYALLVLSVVALVNGLPFTDESENSLQEKNFQFDFWGCPSHGTQ